jgi:hypothetical protein
MANGYKQALARFETAVRADAWKGSMHPEDHPAIERELEAARRALVTKLTYREPRVRSRSHPHA